MIMNMPQVLALQAVTGKLESLLTNSSFPTLVIVTKQREVKEIEPLLHAGHRHFAENYVQEAAEKWPSLRERYPNICLHMIGHLQRNKLAQALQLFDMIQTVDNLRLAEALVRAWSFPHRTKQLLIQVSCSRDMHKTGISVSEVSALFQYMRSHHLPVCGLMGVAPLHGSPIPAFTMLKNLKEAYVLPDLSIGMSRDYIEAAKIGATYLRLGEVIFGKRL